MAKQVIYDFTFPDVGSYPLSGVEWAATYDPPPDPHAAWQAANTIRGSASTLAESFTDAFTSVIDYDVLTTGMWGAVKILTLDSSSFDSDTDITLIVGVNDLGDQGYAMEIVRGTTAALGAVFIFSLDGGFASSAFDPPVPGDVFELDFEVTGLNEHTVTAFRNGIQFFQTTNPIGSANGKFFIDTRVNHSNDLSAISRAEWGSLQFGIFDAAPTPPAIINFGYGSHSTTKVIKAHNQKYWFNSEFQRKLRHK
jgi:hypothetical protein